MAGNLVPLVLLPRYTTYAGASTYTTIAMDVADYEKAIVSFWQGPNVTFISLNIDFQESTDQVTWTSCTGGPYTAPGASSETQFQPSLTKRWFRISVALGGANQITTCWCVGFLMLRES